MSVTAIENRTRLDELCDDEVRDDLLCEEIIRAALCLATAKRPQDFLRSELLLLQIAEELNILRS